jgi:hypothetical protein
LKAAKRDSDSRTEKLLSDLTWRFLSGVAAIVSVAVAFIKVA